MAMFNPSHPGSILREYMGEKITISSMALKLDEAFGTSDGLWYKLQTNYDLAQARKMKRVKVRPLFEEAA